MADMRSEMAMFRVKRQTRSRSIGMQILAKYLGSPSYQSTQKERFPLLVRLMHESAVATE